jgi:hypothetical protein
MIGRLIKRKLDANRLANVFVNSLLEATENGFDEVSQMINEDTAFVTNPGISKVFAGNFLLIIVVGNLRFLDDYFEVDEAKEIHAHIIEKFARIYGVETPKFEALVKEYDKFISRVNHPSKNTLYGMSKAIFHKFDLNEHQETYFKSLSTPNPLFLKRMDEILINFLWDWDQFFKRHKLNFN